MSVETGYLKDGSPVVLRYMTEPDESGLGAFERMIREANACDLTRYSFDRFADGFVLIEDKDHRCAGIESAGPAGGQRDRSGSAGVRGADASKYIAAAALYHMGETFEGRKVEEIFAVTRPDRRNRGCFSLILDLFRKLYPGSAFKFGVYANSGALKTLNRIGAYHSRDELLMSVTLPPHGGEEREGDAAAAPEITVDQGGGKAENAQSRCYFTISGETACIYSVFTWLNHRREGYAHALLSGLLKELSANGVKRAVLQVSSDNGPALALYRGLGFTEKERLSLFYL